MTESAILILIFILILGIDLWLVAMRSSFLGASYARLLSLRERHEKEVAQAVAVMPELGRLRAGFNLGLVLSRFSLAAISFLLSSDFLGISELWINGVVLLVTAGVVFWSEWGVERIVLRDPEGWALRFVKYARYWLFLTGLFLFPLNFSREAQIQGETSLTVTEDEVKTLVDAGEEEGIIEEGEREMIYSIFQLGDTLVREIMVPRIDMLALDVQTPLSQAVETFLQSGFSRLPVYEESVDNTLGLLYAKDLLQLWEDEKKSTSLRELLRPVYFVPEAKKVDELLAEMQNQRFHMAIIVDEYGGVAGLVTLEDIVEEILGEIQDEYDQAEEAPYQQVSDHEYLFQGRIDLDDFNRVMGSALPPDEADTLGGFIYRRLGRVPATGDRVQVENLLLTVEQVSARRIRKVRASWMASATPVK